MADNVPYGWSFETNSTWFLKTLILQGAREGEQHVLQAHSFKQYANKNLYL